MCFILLIHHVFCKTDWESIADRELKDPTPLKEIGQLVELSLKDSKPEVLKRRGRGSFLFEKNSLYSDQIMDNSTSDAFDDHPECETSKGSYHTDYCNCLLTT